MEMYDQDIMILQQYAFKHNVRSRLKQRAPRAISEAFLEPYFDRCPLPIDDEYAYWYHFASILVWDLFELKTDADGLGFLYKSTTPGANSDPDNRWDVEMAYIPERLGPDGLYVLVYGALLIHSDESIDVTILDANHLGHLILERGYVHRMVDVVTRIRVRDKLAQAGVIPKYPAKRYIRRMSWPDMIAYAAQHPLQTTLSTPFGRGSIGYEQLMLAHSTHQSNTRRLDYDPDYQHGA